MKILIITIALLCIVVGLTILGIIAQIKKDEFLKENYSLSEDNKKDN